MPTTFTAISLGKLADIDSFEGNNTAENASALVGKTFGGSNDPLAHNSVTWSPVGNPGSYYNMNNMSANDRLSINGGPPQGQDLNSADPERKTLCNGRKVMKFCDPGNELLFRFDNNFSLESRGLHLAGDGQYERKTLCNSGKVLKFCGPSKKR